MAKCKFSKKDRVFCCRDGQRVSGMVGTVLCNEVEDDGAVWVGVVFDENFGGHSLDGQCDSGYGYWVREECLDYYEDKPFEIEESDIHELFSAVIS